ELVLALPRCVAEVLRVHVLAGADVARRDADHLPVLVHGTARGDVPQRDLVPARDGVEHADDAARGEVDGVARREVARRDGDVVLGPQDEHGRGGRARGPGHDRTADRGAASAVSGRSSDTPRSPVRTTCPVSSERFTATPTATLRRPSTYPAARPSGSSPGPRNTSARSRRSPPP